MLKGVLDKSTCAKCKFCCGFDKEDSWEIPVINEALADELRNKGIKIDNVNGCYKYNLEFEGNEIKYCPFLDEKTGCTLDNENKPFDCKIWPLRVMKKGNKKVLAIAKTCPAFSVTKADLLRLISERLLEEIKEHISKNPYVINELKEDYEVLAEF